MVDVEYTKPDGTTDTFSLDKRLARGVEKIKDRINKKDADAVYLVDGAEGSGKSVFAMQYAKAIDPTFCLERVCLNPSTFIKAVQDAKKGEAIVYDEAYTGLASRQSLSEINKLIVALMMEMRQKNLVVIIVLPTFFMLDKYVGIFRSKGLFHVYTNKGRRGYFLFFNQKNKRKLYLAGRKMMSYEKPRVDFKGHFYGKYVVDEDKYREKKDYHLKHRELKTREEKYTRTAGLLIAQMLKEKNFSHVQGTQYLKSIGVDISSATVSRMDMQHRDLLK